MPPRLSDRLSAARRRRFVGRVAEQTLFESALASLDSAERPFQLLYIFGPGGVGKTTLLNEFIDICGQARVQALTIDARNIEPTTDSFLEALRLALNAPPSESPLSVLTERAAPHVILIDTYEILAPLNNWLYDSFLPQLPDNALIVLAGRQPPSPAWRADPGWQALVRVLSLRNLSPNESRAYLTKQQIPVEQHEAVLDFTHGHPLALSLVADVFAQRPESLSNFQPQAAPDVVKTLLERLVQKVPGPAHRAALEACALVRLTTESLLAEMLSMPDPSASSGQAVHELFEWLRDLSFIDSGPLGLFPHDLTRETLVADLRWRNPDWYVELHRRARNYYTARLGQTSSQGQQRLIFDLLFLHRDNSMVRPFIEWQTSSSILVEAMRDADGPTLVEMVQRHEGDEASKLAALWFAQQPQGVFVFRDPDGQAAGFLAMVSLPRANPEALAADPAAEATWRYVQTHSPLRPGETATLFRFWMARDAYQAVSPAQSVIFINMVRHYLTAPGLVFTFIPCADPDFWTPVFAYAELARLPEADFEVGGRRYGVYGHNWRAMPPAVWLAMLAEKEIGLTPQAGSSPAAEPIVVLSEPEFAAAVQEALRSYVRPDALRGNPLLQSRLVLESAEAGTGPRERLAALQSLIKQAAESLQATPREAKFYRALYHTYFQPAPTQEQAAELLDLPFSTYRRHLKSGIDRVLEVLWQKELHELS